MNKLICFSYYPLLFIYHFQYKIYIIKGDFNHPSALHTKIIYTPGREFIQKIIQKSTDEFIVICPLHISFYKIIHDCVHLQKTLSFPVRNSFVDGFYLESFEHLYLMSPTNLYVINLITETILHTYLNVTSLLLNKTRFHQCAAKNFLCMLKHEGLSVANCKANLSRFISIIYERFGQCHIEFYEQYQNFYIFFCRNKHHCSLLSIDKFNQNLQIEVNLLPVLQNNNFEIDSQQLPFLYQFCQKQSIIQIAYFRIFPRIEKIYSHEIYIESSEPFQHCSIQSIGNYFYFLYENRMDKNIRYVFNCKDKYTEQLISLQLQNDQLISILNSMQSNFDEESATTSINQTTIGKCCICYEKSVKVLFSPCGHLCTCQTCCVSLQHCPLCRASVLFKKICYILET